jgi:hypothetical protein
MMRTTTISAGLAAAFLAVAGMQLPDEALAGNKSLVRKTETKRTDKSNKGTFNKGNKRTFNKGTFTPPNPILPPSPIVPPSPVKR